MKQQWTTKTSWMVGAALSTVAVGVAIGIGCWHIRPPRSGQFSSNSAKPIPVLAPLANSIYPYEQQMQPEKGWQKVAAYSGSGVKNFCPGREMFAVSAPWRLRWRVSQIPNSAQDSSYVTIRVIDLANAGAFRRVESNAALSEFSSEVFTVTGSEFCVLAKSSSTDYTIWVEQEEKPQLQADLQVP